MSNEVWTLHFAEHTTTCEVRRNANNIWDLLISVDGELVIERGYTDESSARERAQISEEDYKRSGWTETDISGEKTSTSPNADDDI